jgi:hypothetical protein
VRSTNAGTEGYWCVPSSGMSSGSSGASRASRSDSSTVRLSDASSSTFVDAEARRRPIVLVMVTVVSVTPPAVVISLAAKRVLPLHPDEMLTRVCSAVARERTRVLSARAWSRVSIGMVDLVSGVRSQASGGVRV